MVAEWKKKRWTDTIWSCQGRIEKICVALEEEGITNDRYDYLASLGCNMDEAISEIEEL